MIDPLELVESFVQVVFSDAINPEDVSVMGVCVDEPCSLQNVSDDLSICLVQLVL